MGKKSSSKQQDPARVDTPAKRFNPLLAGALIVALVGLGSFAFWRANTPADAGAAATTAASTANGDTAATPTASDLNKASPESEAAAQAAAALGPHKQKVLPPIPFRGYAPPRPAAVVTAAYEFAAEHPEVLAYVPCFCGCERAGHRGNEDCFVRARGADGDVTEWEDHGVECAVCIDVATRSRQMHASGASVRDIRAAIEKEFVPTSPVMTPTPKPPAHDH